VITSVNRSASLRIRAPSNTSPGVGHPNDHGTPSVEINSHILLTHVAFHLGPPSLWK